MFTVSRTTETEYELLDHEAQMVRRLPRVTSVLSLVRGDLKEWPADVLHHAAERGKAVHRACWILSGGDQSGLWWPSVKEEIIGYVHGFGAFITACQPRFIHQECLVVSQRYGYAGRLDLLAEINRVLGILDIKTGERHASHAIQDSAYLEAYNEQTGNRKRLKRWVLYLKPTGLYRLVDCDETTKHEQDFKVFCALLRTYRWLQEHGNGY